MQAINVLNNATYKGKQLQVRLDKDAAGVITGPGTVLFDADKIPPWNQPQYGDSPAAKYGGLNMSQNPYTSRPSNGYGFEAPAASYGTGGNSGYGNVSFNQYGLKYFFKMTIF